MSEFKIEKGIPMPARATRAFENMEVGDSVFLAGKTPGQSTALIARTKQRTKFKFSTRTVVENEVNGTRVWRVA